MKGIQLGWFSENEHTHVANTDPETGVTSTTEGPSYFSPWLSIKENHYLDLYPIPYTSFAFKVVFFYINENFFVYYVSGIILLISTFMRFISIVTCSCGSFIFCVAYYSITWMHPNLSIVLLMNIWIISLLPIFGSHR